MAEEDTLVTGVIPTIEEVVLTTTDPNTNSTFTNLTAYFINVTEGVKNITDWRVGGSSIAKLNMPFEGGSTDIFTRDYSTFGNDGTVVSAAWKSDQGYDGLGTYYFCLR